MKERFTEEEWRGIMALPFAIFGVVAGADGTIDEQEVGEFTKRMLNPTWTYKDAMHQELAVAVAGEDISVLIKEGMALDPEPVKTALKEKLTQDEYQSFLGSVFIDELAVARASGGGIFHKEKIGDEETEKLVGFAAYFGIDLPSVQRIFS
ncbi:MAG TPA: hypothetical protein VF097_07080 [Actinomycetota bacterium]